MRRVRDAVADEVANVTEYRAGIRPEVQRTGNSRGLVPDFMFASQVVDAARELPRWRRCLVRRRVFRLVGPLIFDLAKIRPVTERTEAESKLAPWFAESVTSDVYTDEDFQGGKLARALREEPGSKAVRSVQRNLARLAASW